MVKNVNLIITNKIREDVKKDYLFTFIKNEEQLLDFIYDILMDYAIAYNEKQNEEDEKLHELLTLLYKEYKKENSKKINVRIVSFPHEDKKYNNIYYDTYGEDAHIYWFNIVLGSKKGKEGRCYHVHFTYFDKKFIPDFNFGIRDCINDREDINKSINNINKGIYGETLYDKYYHETNIGYDVEKLI